jgi:hypothetical protein
MTKLCPGRRRPRTTPTTAASLSPPRGRWLAKPTRHPTRARGPTSPRPLLPAPSADVTGRSRTEAPPLTLLLPGAQTANQ